jgi:hypothetical protein
MKTLGSQLDPALLARSRRYEKLTLLLRQHLPPECDNHYAVTSIRQQELVIMADSPVWATRLRQLAPQILDLIKRELSQVQHVQIKSRIATAARPATATSSVAATPVKRQLSQRASQQIRSAAACISDEALKTALLKLARHQRKPGS